GLLLLLMVLDQRDDLVAVLLEELALDGHVAGGKAVLDALARGTHHLHRVALGLLPRPAALVERRLAFRASSAFRRLVGGIVGIVLVVGAVDAGVALHQVGSVSFGFHGWAS